MNYMILEANGTLFVRKVFISETLFVRSVNK